MNDESNRPFKVYCLRSGTAERKVVGRFARYVEAQVFIHSELLKCENFGADSGRFWGLNGEVGHVHYWVESPPLKVSVGDEV